MSDQTIRPELTSQTHRDGDRILVGPRPVPPFADAVVKRLCPDGHLRPSRIGVCPRCGSTITRATQL